MNGKSNLGRRAGNNGVIPAVDGNVPKLLQIESLLDDLFKYLEKKKVNMDDHICWRSGIHICYAQLPRLKNSSMKGKDEQKT